MSKYTAEIAMTVNGEPNENDGVPSLEQLTQKYNEESQKRFRPDGSGQYVELADTQNDRLAQLGNDPWVDHETLNTQPSNIQNGDDFKVLILGCGFSGLLYAIHLVKAGLEPKDIRLIDVAGGFGGTWYWNRYPGIMCDVESSIYLPLLEDTGFMPKHRFSYGPEIRKYAINMAEKWGLSDSAAFRTQAKSYEWDEDKKRWIVVLRQDRGPNESSTSLHVTAQFVVVTGGVLNHPKAPKIPGIESFAGQMMHTGRWNYDISGGNPDDWTLSGLRGKRVGIVGTGATAIQCVPQLAKYAKELFVFQRTPSSVDERGQRPIDPSTWKEMTAKPGWWRARNENWCGGISGHSVGKNMVNDRWSESVAYKYVTGGKHEKPYALEQIPELIGQALADDAPRAERVRQRVDEIVSDEKTAQALKAWYPIWCKRPCFHDDYLSTFNLPHVTLVDTSPKGIEKVSSGGIVVDEKLYDLDVIIWSTGYRAPVKQLAEPSHNTDTTIKARGKTLAELWKAHGPSTFHGVITSWMPNLFLCGPAQSAACGNYTFALDSLARHGAYILSETLKRAKDPARVTVEASVEGAEAWAAELSAQAMFLAPVSICGPGYINDEGSAKRGTVEENMKRARGTIHPQGILAYVDIVEKWREEGSMKELVIV